MIPLADAGAGERLGAAASVLIFIAVYAACIPAFGVLVTLTLGWLPATLAAVLGAHAIRFVFRRAARGGAGTRLIR